MRHLVIVAHPSESSLSVALARSYAAELESLGHTQTTLDLYRAGFDPLLTAEELAPAWSAHPPPPAIVLAQDQIRAAQAIAVFYPLWWMSMPAILKGYVDRVFARGFAYDARDGVVHGLLTGKKAILVTSSGAPIAALVETGRWGAALKLQDQHIFGAAGFDVLEHVHMDEVAAGLPEAVVTEHFTRVRECARRHFRGA